MEAWATANTGCDIIYRGGATCQRVEGRGYTMEGRGYRVQLASGESRHFATVRYVSTCKTQTSELEFTSEIETNTSVLFTDWSRCRRFEKHCLDF